MNEAVNETIRRPATRRGGWRRAVAIGASALLGAAGVLVTAGPAAADPFYAEYFEDGRADGFAFNGGRWSVAADAAASEGTRVLRQTGTSAGARARVGDTTWQDHALVVRVKPTAWRGTGGAVGVTARIQAGGTSYYSLTLRPSNTVELGRVSGGSTTVLASAPHTATLGGWHTFVLIAHGSDLRGMVDGTWVQAVDAAFARGRTGLISSYAAASFDEFVVDRYEPQPVPDTQAPAQPGPPRVLSVTPTTATVTWPATTDNVGVVSYTVYQGDQFHSQSPVRTVATNDPVTLTLSGDGATLHFAVSARDAAGNISPVSRRATIPQPPTFPRTGDDTVPPTAPGTPVVTGSAPEGAVISWAPATDNLGVVEYHVVHAYSIDVVQVRVKTGATTAVVPTGSFPNQVWVVAYDASWNASRSAAITLDWPTPAPTRPPA